MLDLRQRELQELIKYCSEPSAQLILVYGLGKTTLVRQALKSCSDSTGSDSKVGSIPIRIDRKLIEDIQAKERIFRENTKTSKAISWVLIASSGVYYERATGHPFIRVLTLEALFQRGLNDS